MAVLVNFAADSIVVEHISLRAFNAVSVGPGLASEVVVDELDEVGVVEFRAKGGEGLRGVDLREVDSLS